MKTCHSFVQKNYEGISYNPLYKQLSLEQENTWLAKCNMFNVYVNPVN